MTHREALEEALAALLHVEIPLGHEFHVRKGHLVFTKIQLYTVHHNLALI